MLLAVKILLTIVTLGYSLIPALADLNKTHATNPRWTGHARFHCVWQVVSYIILAIAMLAIIWFPILPERPQLILPLDGRMHLVAGEHAHVLGPHGAVWLPSDVVHGFTHMDGQVDYVVVECLPPPGSSKQRKWPAPAF